jgi:hypothetical protein
MTWPLRDGDYEIELDGRIVACGKPFEGEVWPVVGSLMKLSNVDGGSVVGRVTRIVRAEFKRENVGFMQEGMPDWAVWEIERELDRKSHPGNPIRLGRIVLERVEHAAHLTPGVVGHMVHDMSH